jgi:hypothetical protein
VTTVLTSEVGVEVGSWTAGLGTVLAGGVLSAGALAAVAGDVADDGELLAQATSESRPASATAGTARRRSTRRSYRRPRHDGV